MKVLVIGSNGGIGSAVVEKFKENSYEVIGWGRNELDLYFGEIPNYFIDTIFDCNVIVNAAGYFGEDYEQMMNVNFKFNWELVRFLGNALPFHQSLKTIIVGSLSYLSPSPLWSLYACSKVPLETLVKARASLLLENNVYLNLVNPPPTDTKMRWNAKGFREDWLMKPSVVANSIFELSQSTRSGAIVNL